MQNIVAPKEIWL